MSLLISGVFGDEVEVFATDDEGSVHFGRHNGACEDTATDGDFAGEGTFLVCNVSVRYGLQILKSIVVTLKSESYRCMCPRSQFLVS